MSHPKRNKGLTAALALICTGGSLAASSMAGAAGTGPSTTISGPSGTVSATTATFTFAASTAGSTFGCQLDSNAWTVCASPKTYSQLSSGSHTFKVVARASGGTVGPQASQRWTVSSSASAPPPPPPPPPPPGNGSVVFNGDFSTGDLSQFNVVEACPGPSPAKGIQAVSSPVHPGYKYSAMFTVTDQSINPICANLGSPGNPEANLIKSGLFTPGKDLYIGFSTFFPSNFPTMCTPWVSACWMQVMEMYGRPYGGSSPVAIGVVGNKMVMGNHTGTIWTSSQNITKGTAWEDIVIHVVLSTSSSVGYVELWNNGVQQTFTNGSTKFYEATMANGVNWDGTNPDALFINQYRGPNPALGTVVLYHAAVKVGTTYASAAP
jgi:hypothetical protein